MNTNRLGQALGRARATRTRRLTVTAIIFSALNQSDPIPAEDWRSLRLDIQDHSVRTVQEALSQISEPQGASGLGNASQRVLIEALPPVLVPHLNRVQYNAAAGGIAKIGEAIRFEPELEIPLDVMVPTAERPSEPLRYKLCGVLYHHGESAGSGKYTVDVLRPSEDGNAGEVWLLIDDETVDLVQHGNMFVEHDTSRPEFLDK